MPAQKAPRSVPLLMYHKVGAPYADKRDRFLNVSQRSFERQMRLLRRVGYTGVTFEDAILGLYHGKALPPRPVCVTFDDGYLCVEQHAAQVLEKLGWVATVFAPTDYVGKDNAWEADTDHPILPIMDWNGLRKLASSGWEIAGHTRTHPRMADLNDPEAIRELTESQNVMEAEFGRPARTFCYPLGSVGKRTPKLVRGAGFIGACTTKSGIARPGADPYLLPRVKVAYRDDVWGLWYRLVIRPRLG